MPCFVLRSMYLHVCMFRSTCLGFYAMFSYVSTFLLYVDVKVMHSHACYALLGSMCLCTFCHVSSLDLYPYMLIYLDPFSAMSLCYVSMPICLDLCFYMLVCMGLCSLHALC